MKTVKTKDLVVGQMYYFDNTKDSYGKLIKKDAQADEIVFKLLSEKTGGYPLGEDNTIAFPYVGSEEWVLIQPEPIPNDVIKIVEKYGDKLLTYYELLKK